MKVLCSSPWVPFEWIHAHGLDPRGVWAEASGLPGPLKEGVCAFAQQLAEFPNAAPGSALIYTTACDQLRRAYDTAARCHPRLFLFNLPAAWQSPSARRLFLSELKRLGRFLVQLGGQTPQGERLATVMLDWDSRRNRLRTVLQQVRARQAAGMLMTFFQTGNVEGVDGPRPATAQGVPLAVLGGPILRSQLDLFDAVECAGGGVVLNATEPGERCLIPPLPPGFAGKEPLACLADHYFDHSIDVFHRPNTRLYAWLGQHLAERGVRGVVLTVHVGCDLWRGELASLREAFGLPVLLLEEHETRAAGPRVRTRLGAFVEALR